MPDERRPRFCSEHKKEEMIPSKVAYGRCQNADCLNAASFNFKGEKKMIFCAAHRLPHMVNLRVKLVGCKFEGCPKYANYNFEGLPKQYCSKHKTDGMVINSLRGVHRNCEFSNCKRRPLFKFSSDLTSRFCCDHKIEGMVAHGQAVKAKRPARQKRDPTLKCKFPGCSLKASFKFITDTNFIYCRTHKVDGMRGQYTPCEQARCFIVAHFNYEGQTKARFCAAHRLDGMIDVVKKKCEAPDCTNNAYYNYGGAHEKKPRFCNTHRLQGMYDVKSRKCKYPDCKISPCFNYPGLTSRSFCGTHKSEGMVNLRYYKGPLCKTPNNRTED